MVSNGLFLNSSVKAEPVVRSNRLSNWQSKTQKTFCYYKNWILVGSNLAEPKVSREFFFHHLICFVTHVADFCCSNEKKLLGNDKTTKLATICLIKIFSTNSAIAAKKVSSCGQKMLTRTKASASAQKHFGFGPILRRSARLSIFWQGWGFFFVHCKKCTTRRHTDESFFTLAKVGYSTCPLF